MQFLKQLTYLDKIEKALGILLEDPSDYITDIVTAVEDEMDCGPWPDEIYEELFLHTEEDKIDLNLLYNKITKLRDNKDDE